MVETVMLNCIITSKFKHSGISGCKRHLDKALVAKVLLSWAMPQWLFYLGWFSTLFSYFTAQIKSIVIKEDVWEMTQGRGRRAYFSTMSQRRQTGA